MVARLVADVVSDKEATTRDGSCLADAGMVFLEVRKCVIVYKFVQNVAWEGFSAVTRRENSNVPLKSKVPSVLRARISSSGLFVSAST